MAVRTLQDLLDSGVMGRTVLVRSDLNVPVDAGVITDPGRIVASAPTLRALADAGAKVVVVAHLGRPAGESEPRFSLAPLVTPLSQEVGRSVQLAGDVVGPDAQARAARLQPGEVLLLENVRFDPREASKDDRRRAALAAGLAALAGPDGAFVSDGFGVVHRKQASVYDIALVLPHYAGLLVQTEVSVLQRLTVDAKPPYTVVLGGSKVSDKLAVIEALAPRVDSLVIGGGMCFTFLAAQGVDVRASLRQEEMIDTCAKLLASNPESFLLPTDVVAADRFSADAHAQTVPVTEIPLGWMGLDIGPQSAQRFAAALADVQTVFWNGPMGVFEFGQFAAGTRVVAEALVAATRRGAFTVVGGGDTAAAVRRLGLPLDGFSHISTGGGASLEYLEGATLPGLAVLEDSTVVED